MSAKSKAGKPRNSGKKWTGGEIANVRNLAKQGKTTYSIAKKLGRTEAAVRAKAKEKRITLKPID